MEYTQLGRTGLTVSRAGFGGGGIGQVWGPTDEAEAIAAVHRALDLGITFFDVAPAYGDGKAAELLSNPGIVRNRQKVSAAIGNARAFLETQQEFGSFDRYIWGFVGGSPLKNSWGSLAEVPASTPLSEAVSKDLRRRGFKFVGPTICYSFMQATGMVNDHTTDCFRYGQVG